MSGISFNIELLGMPELTAVFEQAPDKVAQALATAITDEVLAIFNESQIQVPVEFGTLRSSGQMDPAEVSGSQVSVTFGYGGAASEYAVIVHEDLEAYHDDGKAKYLEDPLMAATAGMSERIGAALAAALG